MADTEDDDFDWFEDFDDIGNTVTLAPGDENLDDEKLEFGKEAFATMLKKCEPFDEVLEVGAGSGENLYYLHQQYGMKIQLHAVESDPDQFGQLKSSDQYHLQFAWNCYADRVPLPDGCMDLVFTSGSLHGVPKDNLKEAVKETVRVSRKYVLCAESCDKIDFGQYYRDNFPDLECVDEGTLPEEQFPGFDNMKWWLFKVN